jgi:hypothetical protein
VASDRTTVNADTWFEFFHAGTSCCGLCGNSGIVDTRDHVVDPRGVECGVRAFCLCPNGRALKEHLRDELPPEEPKESVH